MPTELEVKFAKKIRDGFLQHISDIMRDERDYFCEFCDADHVNVWGGEKPYPDMHKTFKHEDDCVVNDAMRVLKNAIGGS